MRVAEVPAESESEGSLARADGSVRNLRRLVSGGGIALDGEAWLTLRFRS